MALMNELSTLLITGIYMIFNTAYKVYNNCLYGTLFMLFPYKRVSEIEEIHENIISSCDTYCKNVIYEVSFNSIS